MYIWIVLGLFGLLNLVAFFLIAWDKRKATKGLWRTPEKYFYSLAFLGGGLGLLLGMSKFRHKTQKWAFKWRLYLALLLNLAWLAVLAWLFFEYGLFK